ncbi:MAG: hypothetical protein IAE93_10370 [Ignavibacteria bacterium]|nr:hypothetical protein [Ignavibacteria bacterium]
MNIKNIIIAAVMGSMLIGFNGCSLLKKRVEKKENVKYTLNGNGKTSIHIENINGKINISNSGDTTGIISIDAEVIADVKHDEQDRAIENVKIKIDTTTNEIKIETEINNTSSGMFRKSNNAEVNYTLKIPANMKVHTETVNGSTTITRINNDVRAETVNGKVNIFNCRGIIDVDGVNGSVLCNVDSLTAGIRISIVNGDVKIGGLKNVDADVSASTVHGRVKFKDLTFTDINSEKRTLSGILGKGGSTIRVESTNGSISLDASKILPKKDDSFEFKIDFNDNDGPSIDVENSDDDQSKDSGLKTGNDTQSQLKGNTPMAPKNADSTRK